VPHGWALAETRKLFDMLQDPRPGHGVLGVSDPDVTRVGDTWSMLLGAFTTRFVVRIVEARLPSGAPVDDDGWSLLTDTRGRAVQLGAPARKDAWDFAGMHTPCRVRGTAAGRPIERVYYAGRRSRRVTGPHGRYAIGFLEHDGGRWLRRESPVLTGDDERPSALEPFVVHAGGRWRMWFLSAIGEVGRGQQPDYELRYTESDDGERWSVPESFATQTEGFFDNAVARTPNGDLMLLARGTNLHGTSPFPAQGLWLATARGQPAGRDGWTTPQRILDTDAGAEPWYAAGVCGPAAVVDGDRLHVFATGTYPPTSWWAAALDRLRAGRRPPPPAPFYLATGRFTFRR
jgi:hypothetical protein